MSPPVIQLLFLAIGVAFIIKYMSTGLSLCTLSLGWWLADSAPLGYSGYIWLASCLLFGIIILHKYEQFHARNRQINQ